MAKDLLKRFEPGQVLSAEQLNRLVEAVQQGLGVTGPDVFIDSTGAHFRSRRSTSTRRYRGKLDADLAYNSTTGVTLSIWALNDSNVWADTNEDIEGVLPPCNLAHALVPSGVWVEIEQQGGKWCVVGFPVLYSGTLAGDLAASGTATVTVGGDSFTGCKAWAGQTVTIASGANVVICLMPDGYYSVVQAVIAVTVITDLQLGTGYLQKKTRSVLAFAAGAESSWTNAIQTTDCPE